jgi:hypothetical protein
MTVWVLIHSHKHGVDVGVYSTEERAWDAAEALEREYAEDFASGEDECEVVQREVE